MTLAEACAAGSFQIVETQSGLDGVRRSTRFVAESFTTVQLLTDPRLKLLPNLADPRTRFQVSGRDPRVKLGVTDARLKVAPLEPDDPRVTMLTVLATDPRWTTLVRWGRDPRTAIVPLAARAFSAQPI